LPTFVVMLILVSVVLSLVPEELILRYLGGGTIYLAVLSASALRSVMLMPRFIAFPLVYF